MNTEKILKYISFGLAAAVVIMMAAATVIEKLYGTPIAFSAIYHSPVFIAFWAIMAVTGIIWLVRRGAVHRVATFMLHASFVLILAGALITLITGRNGMIHLRQGQSTSEWMSKDGFRQELPFSITLTGFNIDYYTGSMAASDYKSSVRISDVRKSAELDREISMNNILKYKGYRFYQSSYDEDLKGSILSVSYDPWGVSVTYTGYLILLISIIGFFFQKNSGFRAAVTRIRKHVLTATILFACCGTVQAKTDYELYALPDSIADHFARLHVYYNDRIAPFQTLARDYSLKAYGKNGYNGYSSTQVVTGWLFWYDWWNVVPFKLKAKERGTSTEAEKEAIRMEAATGQAFRIFPIRIDQETGLASENGDRIVWFSCTDPLPENLDYGVWVFCRRSLDLIHDAIKDNDWQEADRIILKIGEYQKKIASSVLPSRSRFRAEMIYNGISRPMIPFMASITLGLILFVATGIMMARNRKTPQALRVTLTILAALLWIYLTFVLGLRWYISGHAPFAGSYSVMMLMAWLVTLAMMLFGRSLPIIQPMGFILAGFTMLVASLSSSNPQVTHLMPVLQSPLLSIHVLCMMISYTLFGLVALTGIMGLVMPRIEAQHMLRDVSLTILYPAVFILTIGTFLGAVWANISWGSYWAWDPKETWALITMMVYGAMLHGSTMSKFNSPRFFHTYAILAFLSVLITYFGVNLLLGGMHSYS
ncbi:MAG: cytochrome c biogenesis protein CcsA [Bacteroidaceae bacterium]|nr:cytochrome c biogenesis protein CcsA [Bacteroidaceae bacterium]